MTKILKNPLFIYVLGFIFTFLLYNLEWSGIYPELSKATIIFLIITFVTFAIFGTLMNVFKRIKKTPAITNSKLVLNLTIVLFTLYSIEFYSEKDIPIISKILGNEGVSYLEFGLPVLHGILISLNSFLIAHSFSMYMAQKKSKILINNFLLYLPPILFLSRSIIVMGVLTSLFIYIHYTDRIKSSIQIKIVFMSLLGLFLFGVLGNLRSGGDYIYETSKAKKEFLNSSIPKEYYWTYLYVASPLANFQNTIDKKNVKSLNMAGFIFYENMPIIITKNLGSKLKIEERDLSRIVPWLTVGTTYAKSYSYLEWYGPYLQFIINLFIYLFIIIFLVPRNSSYHITLISILSVIILLNIFSNILVVTGISFQIIYCAIFSYLENKKFVLK